MKLDAGDGCVEFRPSRTAASLPIAAAAVSTALIAMTGAFQGWWPAWVVFTAIAGALFAFGISFLMPWLQTVRVRAGEISAPAGYGDNTLRIERVVREKCYFDAFGSAWLIDDLGSRVMLNAALLRAEEIEEALLIFGIDPDAMARIGGSAID
ncbi:hypothetical protein [Noviluteimonas gilva]|uniref:Uncharacterized protein n=1 Tax=Noviluteimonas gilva TaxID=2682097 RepID=A0A7C9HPD2_9GAMM|nr:hypothetical protein [Lysobacter gilvus]MUV15696.1 hypothetical protein [Lysobacter gilvus]